MMVSLGNGSRGSGGHFFSNDPLVNQEEEILVDRGTLSTEEQPQFQQSPTVWVSIFLLICLVVFEVLLFLIPLWCQGSFCIIQDYSALVCLQTAFWGFLLLIDQCLRWQHRLIRKRGYLQFCRKTHVMKRGALYIFSLGNACLLLFSVIFQEFCCSPSCIHSLYFQPINYLQLVMTIEVVISFPVIAAYLAQTVKFNTKKPVPDVNQDDLLASFSQVRVPSTEIGYRYDDPVEDVIERQADVIHYLKQHNVHLGRKIVQLMSELNSYKSV